MGTSEQEVQGLSGAGLSLLLIPEHFQEQAVPCELTAAVRAVSVNGVYTCVYTCGSVSGAICLLRLFTGPGNITGV